MQESLLNESITTLCTPEKENFDNTSDSSAVMQANELESLRCPCCNELFSDCASAPQAPIMLSCGHIACSTCCSKKRMTNSASEFSLICFCCGESVVLGNDPVIMYTIMDAVVELTSALPKTQLQAKNGVLRLVIDFDSITSLECLVCGEVYCPTKVSPQQLSCGHSTCLTCIERMRSVNNGVDNQQWPFTVDCPKCKQVSKLKDGREHSITARGVVGIVEELKRLATTTPKFMKHCCTVECKGVDELDRLWVCETCGKADEENLLCAHCVLSLHDNHKVTKYLPIKLNSLATERRQSVENQIDTYRDFIGGIVEKNRELMNQFEEIMNTVVKNVQYATSIESAHKTLSSCEVAMIGYVEANEGFVIQMTETNKLLQEISTNMAKYFDGVAVSA